MTDKTIVKAIKWTRRQYQKAALLALRTRRCFALSWRRQGGKSTVMSEMAIDEMSGTRGRSVIYVSAALLLGREIIYKESQVLQRAMEMLRSQADGAGLQLQTLNRETSKSVKDLSTDDFAELFESQRLEFRLYFDKTTFSRTQVIAPNVATARGWAGTVLADEYGFIRDWRDLMEAIEPIISTDRTFKLVQATTPPKDDSHFSYEQTAPPVGTKFKVNPKGNWYKSEHGLWVHRVDIYDAAAAGVPLYDLETGKELTPEEHFKQARDKDAWRRNYKVEYVLGGAAACGLMQLDTAQQRGIGKCAFFYIDDDLDFVHALTWLHENLGTGTVGLGWDTATTEKGTSNPSSFSITEQVGIDLITRAILVWKTKDPDVAEDRAKLLVKAIADRKAGGRAKRLCIDATNEKYFASRMKKVLAPEVQVELVVGSEKFDKPGFEPTNFKQHLGSLLVGELDDNHLTLPSERYVREDFRLVMKERGAFVCEPDAEGRHGDTFDSTKLSIFALKGAPPPPLPHANANSRVARVKAARRDRTAVAA